MCKYIDIPIQHCNDDVLKRMNRTTSKEQIVSVVSKLRDQVPGIAIRTTLIAGFPGETEEQFNELAQFVENMNFDRLGAFAYSQEEDTAAAKFEDQLDEEVKLERQNKIMAIQMGVSERITASRLGTIMDVLIEEPVEGENVYVGRTSFDSPEVDGVAYVHASKELELGTIVKCKITDTMEYDLIGDYYELS